MKVTRLLTGIIFLFVGLKVVAQCDYSLNKLAIEMGDSNAIYVRDFRAKLKSGSPKNPTPLAKYALYLEKDNLYQLHYAQDTLLPGEPVLHLYQKNKLLESNFDATTNLTKDVLTYYCETTGNYRLYISFKEAQKGCVAVLLSKLNLRTEPKDSISDIPQILYTGIDNLLEITDPEIRLDSVEYSITRGELLVKGNDIIIRADEPGELMVEMTVRDSTGEIKHTIQTPFMVEKIPPPQLSFNGKTGGYISKSALIIQDELQMNFSVPVNSSNFRITEFTVSTERDGIRGVRSLSSRMSTLQLQFLETLNEGDRFYIKNIQIEGQKYILHEPMVLEFIIQ